MYVYVPYLVDPFSVNRGNGFENTCLNKNFHSLKSNFAPKTSFLGDSSLARISASVLEYNGEQWRTILANALNLSAIFYY